MVRNTSAITMKHVSVMGTCSSEISLNVKKMKKGQKWTLSAEYDFEKWQGMMGEDGR
jgi:hypothetical protein